QIEAESPLPCTKTMGGEAVPCGEEAQAASNRLLAATVSNVRRVDMGRILDRASEGGNETAREWRAVVLEVRRKRPLCPACGWTLRPSGAGCRRRSFQAG